MKNIYFIPVFLLLNGMLAAQSINQLTILPSSPGPNDTVRVISDITYTGNCTYGLVYYHVNTVGSAITIMPLYCGYWDSTVCNSIDTFVIGTLPNGNYTLTMDYHQGSVCPISNFDATILGFDTVFTVGGAITGLNDETLSFVTIYPNPAQDRIFIQQSSEKFTAGQQIKIINTSGQSVYETPMSVNPMSLNITGWKKAGTYFVYLFDMSGNILHREKITIH